MDYLSELTRPKRSSFMIAEYLHCVLAFPIALSPRPSCIVLSCVVLLSANELKCNMCGYCLCHENCCAFIMIPW